MVGEAMTAGARDLPSPLGGPARAVPSSSGGPDLPALLLGSDSPDTALRSWLREIGAGRGGREDLLLAIARALSAIDGLLSAQVSAVIHHPRFQALEASWRGLRYLVDQAGDSRDIKIRILGASWRDLARDVERASEFDQTAVFRKVYSDEFGMPGGEPFGVLLGDYEIRHRPGPDHPIDDLEVLASLAGVGAASFAPFIAAASPALFGMESFGAIERPANISRIFEDPEYLKWRAFRETEDSRFVGLVLPRILLRAPWADDGSRADGFRFREDVARGAGHLWGNAIYALGGVLIRAFQASGWLAEIRGVRRGEEGGGLVTGLPVPSSPTDLPGVAPKGSAEISVGDRLEKELGELGFIPLCQCPDTDLSAFYSTQSVQKPRAYGEPAATVNARMSSMLHYMLCVSRFAHYLKVRTQYKIGSFTAPREIEDDLNRWIQDYVAPDADAAASVKARFPLREARVAVGEMPGKPGSFVCTMHLVPHYQLDSMAAAVTLRTVMAPGGTR